MLKTSDILIENNLIFHSQMSGITFEVEKDWMEADYGQNIIIRNNHFIDCGYAYDNPNTPAVGIVNFIGMGDENNYAPIGQYKDIIIEKNIMDGVYKTPFVLSSSENISIKHNTIRNSHFMKSLSGSKVGINQSAMIWLKNCSKVDVQDNTLENNQIQTELGIISGELSEQFSAGTQIELLVRPDDIVHDDKSQTKATVIAKDFRGAGHLYTLRMPGSTRLLCLAPSHHNHHIGEQFGVRLNLDHLVIFSRELV